MVLDGDDHLRQRRLMLGPFHGERMRAYRPAIEAAADRAIDSWPVGRSFALLPSMYSISLEVIMRAVFGLSERELGSTLATRMRAMMDAGPLLYSRRRRAADELIHAEIDRRRSEQDLGRREDVLSKLIEARDEHGSGMSDDELHDELVTLLIAGHETTAATLAWAFELMARNPAVLDRLRQSLDDGERDYLEAVVAETLRIRPTASGIGRLVSGEPLALGCYTIPVGFEVTTSIEAIHRRADRYPDPASFRPERFLGDRCGADEAWIPYGGGTRRCLGAAFASFEIEAVVSRVLERTTLLPAGERPERSVRRAVTPPTLRAFGRAMRRGRRPLPKRGVRVVQPAAPLPVTALPGRPRPGALSRVAAAG